MTPSDDLRASRGLVRIILIVLAVYALLVGSCTLATRIAKADYSEHRWQCEQFVRGAK